METEIKQNGGLYRVPTFVFCQKDNQLLAKLEKRNVFFYITETEELWSEVRGVRLSGLMNIYPGENFHKFALKYQCGISMFRIDKSSLDALSKHLKAYSKGEVATKYFELLKSEFERTHGTDGELNGAGQKIIPGWGKKIERRRFRRAREVELLPGMYSVSVECYKYVDHVITFEREMRDVYFMSSDDGFYCEVRALQLCGVIMLCSRNNGRRISETETLCIKWFGKIQMVRISDAILSSFERNGRSKHRSDVSANFLKLVKSEFDKSKWSNRSSGIQGKRTEKNMEEVGGFMGGFSEQELKAVHTACIYKANVLIDSQLYVLNALRTEGGITKKNSVDVKWLTNTAQFFAEIADCMKNAAKLMECISKKEEAEKGNNEKSQ